MSVTSHLLLYFTISTVILYFGPSVLLIPGLRDSLPLTHTQQGPARGETWTSRNGRPFFAFRSIPFAKPPTGERRFRAPVPLDEDDSWQKPRDFHANPPQCYQNSFIAGAMGEEDCLYLNVYTPVLDTESPLPVIVYIHGGGFVQGSASASQAGPHFFMDEDVVLVSIQYRLGPLGFLSLQNEDIKGNQGLWDQQLALIWVQQNIHYFGGDKNLVTLFGISAGSMSISYHLTSPSSWGLFHRAILSSGTSISQFTRINRPPVYYGRELGAAVGCRDANTLAACLTATPLHQLYQHQDIFSQCAIIGDIGHPKPNPWVPTVDSWADRPFVPGDPEQLLQEGKIADVPVMMGFMEQDGLLYTTRFLRDPAFSQTVAANWSTCATLSFLGLPEADLQLAERLTQAYGVKQEDGSLALNGMELTDLMTDAVFAESSYRLSQYLAMHNRPVFRWVMSYVGSISLADFFSSNTLDNIWRFIKLLLRLPTSKGLGACHGDDSFYLFSNLPLVDMLPGELDRQVSRQLVGWLVSFARTGRPDQADWRQVSAAHGDAAYWNIGADSGMVERPDLVERFARWSEINSRGRASGLV